jgi:hypothetical protein
MLTTGEFAKLHKLTIMQVTNLIQTGRLDYVRRERWYLIPPEAKIKPMAEKRKITTRSKPMRCELMFYATSTAEWHECTRDTGHPHGCATKEGLTGWVHETCDDNFKMPTKMSKAEYEKRLNPPELEHRGIS